MRQNPHVRICGGPGSATTLVYPTSVRGNAAADLGAPGPGRLTRGECKDASLAKRGHK